MRVVIDSNVLPPTGVAGTIQLLLTEQYDMRTVCLSVRLQLCPRESLHAGDNVKLFQYCCLT
jgi:hypothetical protein